MDLSICVVNFNTKDALARALSPALLDCEGLSAEVIVVDNGSSDGSAAMVRGRFPQVQLVANESNRLFSAAYNQAIALSAGRYVLILNSDVEILPGTLASLIGFMDEHTQVGAATTRMYFPDGRLQTNCARFASFDYLLLEHSLLGTLLPKRRARARRQRWYADWDRKDARPVEVIPGSFMLVRRSSVDRVGSFDERFRLYFGDDDWCKRISEAGFHVMYLPSGGAIHPEGSSTIQVPELTRRAFFDDMHSYTAKHFGRAQALALTVSTWPTRWGMRLAARMRGG